MYLVEILFTSDIARLSELHVQDVSETSRFSYVPHYCIRIFNIELILTGIVLHIWSYDLRS